jgi:hypothetical protein
MTSKVALMREQSTKRRIPQASDLEDGGRPALSIYFVHFSAIVCHTRSGVAGRMQTGLPIASFSFEEAKQQRRYCPVTGR